MQQLRQANMLWTNDSLFLRESLLIPAATASLPGNDLHDDNSDDFNIDDLASTLLRRDSPAGFAPQTQRQGFGRPLVEHAETGHGDSQSEDTVDINRVNAKDYFREFDSKVQRLTSKADQLETKTENW